MDSKFWFVLIGFSVWEVSLAQRISESKCQEYIDFLFEESIAGDLSTDPKIEKYKTTNCSTSVDLIVGGQEALPKEFPHQALLGYAKSNAPRKIEFMCGGSLISEWFVITAAHCQKPKIVRLGEHNLDDDKDGQQDFEVASFTRHPNYRSIYSYHDIALVELAQEVKFSDRIRPACLWTSLPFNMSSAIASGFGQTSINDKQMSSKLMKVKLIMFDGDICNKTFPYDLKLHNGLSAEQLCVGSQEGGYDTCNGDSGGPLQVAVDIETCVYHIVGVTSFGNPRCGVGHSKAVYIKVASYLDWIEPIVWGQDDFAIN